MNLAINNLATLTQRIFFNNRKTLGSLAFKGANIVGQLLIIPLVYNHLNNYEFGIFATINTITIFSLNIDFGVVNAIKNPLHERIQKNDFKQASIIASTAFLFICFISVVLLSTVSILYIFDYDSSVVDVKNYSYVRKIIYLSTIYFLIRFTFQIVHGFNHSINKYYVNDMLLMTGTTLSTIALYIAGQLGVLSLINTIHLYFVFYCLIYCSYFLYFILKNDFIKISFKNFNYSYLRELLGKSMTFFFLQLTWIIVTNFVPIMLAKVVGLSIAGDYSVISRLFNFTYVINLIILNNYWHSIHTSYINKNIAGIKALFNKTSTISGLCCALCVFIFFFNERIINVWIGKSISIDYWMSSMTCIYFISMISLSSLNIFMNSLNKLTLQVKLSIINILLIISIYYMCRYALLLNVETCIFITPILIFITNIVFTFFWIKKNILQTHNI